MSYFDARHEYQRKQGLKYLEYLNNKGARYDLTERKGKRSFPQQKYLEILIKKICVETNDPYCYVKQVLIKQIIAPDIFELSHKGHKIYRSTADLDKREFTLIVERLRTWSELNIGLYLPEPNEREYLESLESEVQKYSNQKFY